MNDFAGPFRLTAADRIFHDHGRFDPANKGRLLRRLPDWSLVYADEYEERFREYEAKNKPAPQRDYESRRRPSNA